MLAQLVEHAHAVDARHHHVDDDGVERQRARQVEPVAAAGGETDRVALAHEQRLENLAHDLLVVDDEDGGIAPQHYRATAVGRAAAIRKRSEKRVPWPGALSQWMVPSCSRTMP